MYLSILLTFIHIDKSMKLITQWIKVDKIDELN